MARHLVSGICECDSGPPPSDLHAEKPFTISGHLTSQGCIKLVSGSYIFILKDAEVVGMTRVHASRDGNGVFDAAEAGAAYRWGWWDEKPFTFAGCQITQAHKEGSKPEGCSDFPMRSANFVA